MRTKIAMSRSASVTWRRALPLLVAGLMLFGACQKKPAPANTLSATPDTIGVLKLMPESAVVAVAIPSVEKAEQQIQALLKRGAPEGVDMDAEITVVTSQMARSANAFEAKSVADIAAIKGLDPERPLAVFIGARKEGETPPSPPGQLEFERQILSYVGFNSIAPMVAVFPYKKRQEAEKFVAEWSGPGATKATDLAEPKTTIQTKEDGSFAYLFTNDTLVAGTSVEMVQGVAERMKTPASVRYGTPECPADSADEIVQLVRTDKIPDTPSSSTASLVDAASNPRAAAWQLWNGWIQSHDSSEPMVITWGFKDDHLTVRSRLLNAAQPDAAAKPASPAPLLHLNTLPKSTLGVWTMQITPQTRETLKTSGSAGLQQQGGAVAQMGQSFDKIIDLVGNEATIAITGPGSDASKIALLVEFTDGDTARETLRSLGFMPIKAETYNNVDIFSFVFPPVSVYYAVAKNTFVMAGTLDSVKMFIDAISQGKPTSFASSLNPPFDTATPRQQAFIAKRDLFTSAMLPALEGYGTVSKTQVDYTTKALEKVRDARMTTETMKDWQDTRLIVQFESAAKS
ncbi:MAG: hypothetical protein IT366_18080 [Candidatus Hydrogenedentes bacterium]|nr:hypothetical protein [Candidatus Hydrogenedentota bacterium]